MHKSVNAIIVAIAKEMSSRKSNEVELEYSGNGDSQDDFSVSVEGANKYLGRRDIISDKLEELVDLVHESYAEDYGGYGDLSIKIKGSKAFLEWSHTDNYEESVEDDDAIMGNNVRDALVDIIRPVATSCTIQYTGGGDSMDGFDVSFFKGTQEIKIDNNDVNKALRDELDSLMEESAVCGFWENAGGHGEIGIDCEDPENSYWNHYDCAVSGESSFHQFAAVIGKTPSVMVKGVRAAAHLNSINSK